MSWASSSNRAYMDWAWGTTSGQGLVDGADVVALEVGGYEAEGGESTGIGRDDDGADVQFLGKASGVDGARATEGNEGEGAGVVAPLDGNLADSIGHAGVHDVDDALGGWQGVEAEALAHAALDGIGGEVGVEAHLAPKEAFGVEVAEDEVGVGDGGIGAACAVAGRTGGRASTVGADAQAATIVHPSDAAATSADLKEVDDGHLDGMAGALEPAASLAAGTADLVVGGDGDLAALDEAGLGGGATHVEGDEVGDA